jgi:hypothetical protein
MELIYSISSMSRRQEWALNRPLGGEGVRSQTL